MVAACVCVACIHVRTCVRAYVRAPVRPCMRACVQGRRSARVLCVGLEVEAVRVELLSLKVRWCALRRSQRCRGRWWAMSVAAEWRGNFPC